MKITKISASAGRTFNHPYEQYANFRFDLHFEAEIAEGEDPDEAARSLAAHAESEAEKHKEDIKADLARQLELASALQEMEFEKRKAFDSEASLKKRQDLEARIANLTSKPLALLGGKQVHPGHEDHPDTDRLGFPEGED